MVSLQPYLDSLFKSLPPWPARQEELDSLVRKVLDESSGRSSAENRKSQWEYLLKDKIFQLAVKEGNALKSKDTTYYNDLQMLLDLVLTFTEQDACEQTFPFYVLQDLLETQTITSCSHIFSWIESRSARLTEGMVPQKGKALVLLRTLNDLLRRLSKSGSTTTFCGRILTFLSGVFPLGERSGVNLRGEYGPTWEDVKYSDVYKKEKDVEMGYGQVQSSQETPAPQEDKMQVDSQEVKRAPQTPEEKKEDFYNTFWHLQLPFSKPFLFVNKETLPEFKEAVNKVLPVIKEATAKERAMMGSRVGVGNGTLKRKRDFEGEDFNIGEYFFAKFLTSPELLDLEVADTHFRRQFLFQLLILLHHLLTFTKAAKATWTTPRNRSLQMDFTLEPEDAQWMQETFNKAIEELKQTTPNGRAFADTIQMILERDKNWIRWKNELCAPFDKETWSTIIEEKKVGLFEATKEFRDKIKEPPADWPYTLGTEPLTEIWEMGYRDLYDLESPFQPGDVKDFVKKVKQEDSRIEMRRKILARNAERIAQAQAKAAAAKAAIQASAEEKESTSESAMDVDIPNAPAPEPSQTQASAPESAPSPATTSTPTASSNPPTTIAPSPLHPSLPPRPTTTQSGPSQGTSTPAAAPSPAPPPAASTPAPGPASSVAKTPEVSDDQIAKYEENKQRWAWLALRTARDHHLQHFGKIGTGDIVLLAQEIEKETQERVAEREKAQKEEMNGPGTVGTDENDSRTPVPETVGNGDSQSMVTNNAPKVAAEEDVAMEGR